MNEIIPPNDPDKELPKPFPTRDYNHRAIPSDPPSKALCAFFGFLLFVLSCGMAFAFPPLFFVGLIAAIITLFFEGYRFIFVGYILTIGLLLLSVIIYCANNPFRV
jgi:hypothetical protein